jgi:hypothetical protein
MRAFFPGLALLALPAMLGVAATKSLKSPRPADEHGVPLVAAGGLIPLESTAQSVQSQIQGDVGMAIEQSAAREEEVAP